MVTDLTTPRAYDNSMLKELSVCPRRFFWAHVACWRAVRSTNHAANFGSVLHEGLATWYSTFDEPAAQASIADAYGKFFPPPAADGTFVLPLDIPRVYTQDNAHTTLANYIQQHPTEFTQQVDCVEQGFAFPIASDDIYYTGKIDLVVQGLSPSAVPLIIDHKTTARASAHLPQLAYPNPQLCGYAWALMHTHATPARAMLNFLILHTAGPVFARTPDILYTDHDLTEWLRSTRHMIERAITYGASGQWPQNTHMCYQLYGTCPYLPLCAMRRDPLDIHAIGPGGSYTKHTWEPFEGARS